MNDATIFIMRLTDCYGDTYDTRTVAAGDVAEFMAIAQQETCGEMWWEVIDIEGWTDLIQGVDWSITNRCVEFAHRDREVARRFKARYPNWRVYVTTAMSAEVGTDGRLSLVSEAEFLAGMGYE